MDLKFATTERGFSRYEFRDRYGCSCSLQKSSLATEDAIWLGCNEPTVHHVTDRASCRMHLTRGDVAALLPILHHFMMTGEVSEFPSFVILPVEPEERS
jgi:hypothetical protein